MNVVDQDDSLLPLRKEYILGGQGTEATRGKSSVQVALEGPKVGLLNDVMVAEDNVAGRFQQLGSGYVNAATSNLVAVNVVKFAHLIDRALVDGGDVEVFQAEKAVPIKVAETVQFGGLLPAVALEAVFVVALHPKHASIRELVKEVGYVATSFINLILKGEYAVRI